MKYTIFLNLNRLHACVSIFQKRTTFDVVVAHSKIIGSDSAVGQLAESSSQFHVPISVVRGVVKLPFRAAFIALRHRITENAVCEHEYNTLLLVGLQRASYRFEYTQV